MNFTLKSKVTKVEEETDSVMSSEVYSLPLIYIVSQSVLVLFVFSTIAISIFVFRPAFYGTLMAKTSLEIVELLLFEVWSRKQSSSFCDIGGEVYSREVHELH